MASKVGLNDKGQLVVDLERSHLNHNPLTLRSRENFKPIIEVFDVFKEPEPDDLLAEASKLIDYRQADELVTFVDKHGLKANYRYERGCFDPNDEKTLSGALDILNYGSKVLVRRRGDTDSEAAIIGRVYLQSSTVNADGSLDLQVQLGFGQDNHTTLHATQGTTAFEIYDFNFRLTEETKILSADNKHNKS